MRVGGNFIKLSIEIIPVIIIIKEVHRRRFIGTLLHVVGKDSPASEAIVQDVFSRICKVGSENCAGTGILSSCGPRITSMNPA